MSKKYYCDSPGDARNYGIFDLSKADKKLEDFIDEDGDICSWMFGCYLVDETDSMMTGEQVCNELNFLTENNLRTDKKYLHVLHELRLKNDKIHELEEQVSKLKEENKCIKSKAYFRDAMDEINYQTSRNKELKQEIRDLKYKVSSAIQHRIIFLSRKPFSVPAGNPASVTYDEDHDRYARLSEMQNLQKELKGVLKYD